MKKAEKLTQKRLKELLHYDPETGIFTRKITVKYNAQKGDVAGCLNKDGYLITHIDNKTYTNHRLAWLYVYGYFPENGIDHKNRIRHHNWISNLREASTQCNARNWGNSPNNTSGVKGVSWDKKRKKWIANITINQKAKYLGGYKSFNDAVCARLVAEQCLDWSGCDSNSPAYQYVQKMLKRKTKKVKIKRRKTKENA